MLQLVLSIHLTEGASRLLLESAGRTPAVPKGPEERGHHSGRDGRAKIHQSAVHSGNNLPMGPRAEPLGQLVPNPGHRVHLLGGLLHQDGVGRLLLLLFDQQGGGPRPRARRLIADTVLDRQGE